MQYTARPDVDSVYADRDDKSGFAAGGSCSCAKCKARRAHGGRLKDVGKADGERSKPRGDKLRGVTQAIGRSDALLLQALVGMGHDRDKRAMGGPTAHSMMAPSYDDGGDVPLVDRMDPDSADDNRRSSR